MLALTQGTGADGYEYPYPGTESQEWSDEGNGAGENKRFSGERFLQSGQIAIGTDHAQGHDKFPGGRTGEYIEGRVLVSYELRDGLISRISVRRGGEMVKHSGA